MRGLYKNTGFTLIELSIVLIIIGLIVGGVLVGQDLIYAAKVRGEFSQIERVDAAVNTFRLKYNALPGDMINATAFGLSINSNGNGNKVIAGVFCESNCPTGSGNINGWSYYQTGFPTKIPEWAMAQQQLSAAGLLGMSIPQWATISEFILNRNGGIELLPSKIPQADGTNILSANFKIYKPALIFGYELNNRVNGHYFRLGSSGGNMGSLRVVSGYLQTPVTAKLIDQKFDDGTATGGRIMAAPWIGSGCAEGVVGTSPTCTNAGGNMGDGSNTNRCLSSSTQDYDTDYDANTCALRVKTSF